MLCCGVEDVLEELDGVSAVATEAKKREKEQAAAATLRSKVPTGLDEVQTRVWEFLGNGPRVGDEIARHVGMDVPRVATVLLTMEMRKVIRRLTGNRYERA